MINETDLYNHQIKLLKKQAYGNKQVNNYNHRD